MELRALQFLMNLKTRKAVGAAYRGLTLGEMLLVLAVFLILAIIFVFSSQSAMVKTKLSRVYQEQNMLARALNMYEADNARVPLDKQAWKALDINVPSDPFNKDQTDSKYKYLSRLSNRYKWVVVSVGPDGVSDLARALEELKSTQPTLSGSQGEESVLLKDHQADRLIREHRYDPTNGSVSAGDIITVYGP
jgi:type II secretory pathway pseudopilin PulG